MDILFSIVKTYIVLQHHFREREVMQAGCVWKIGTMHAWLSLGPIVSTEKAGRKFGSLSTQIAER